MKTIILVSLALVAVAVAAPVDEKQPVEIIRSNFDQDPEGSYVFGYETNDGSKHEATGELKDALDEENKTHRVVVVRGSFSFVDPDGNTQTITYRADETGFHPEGPSIPRAQRR